MAPNPTPDTGWAGSELDTLGAATEAPEFPVEMDHWTLQGQWSTMPRAFTDQWSTAAGPEYDDFPATMNGCADQRFLVRWRVVDDEVEVRAAMVDTVGGVWKQTSGNAGWMDLNGCYAPGFQLAGPTSDGSTLVDVAVEVQQYRPAP